MHITPFIEGLPHLIMGNNFGIVGAGLPALRSRFNGEEGDPPDKPREALEPPWYIVHRECFCVQ